VPPALKGFCPKSYLPSRMLSTVGKPFELLILRRFNV
jgi:hypothetical protein